jgi:hypothetical protein
VVKFEIEGRTLKSWATGERLAASRKRVARRFAVTH